MTAPNRATDPAASTVEQAGPPARRLAAPAPRSSASRSPSSTSTPTELRRLPRRAHHLLRLPRAVPAAAARTRPSSVWCSTGDPEAQQAVLRTRRCGSSPSSGTRFDEPEQLGGGTTGAGSSAASARSTAGSGQQLRGADGHERGLERCLATAAATRSAARAGAAAARSCSASGCSGATALSVVGSSANIDGAPCCRTAAVAGLGRRQHRSPRGRLPARDGPAALPVPAGAAGSRGGGCRLAAAADLRRPATSATSSWTPADGQRVFALILGLVAFLYLVGGGAGALCVEVNVGAGRPAVAAGPAHAVHRRGRAHRGRRAGLCRPGAGAAQRGLRADRRALRPLTLRWILGMHTA